MPITAEYFCLRCQRCIRDVSELKPHFRYCPEAEIQKISYVPPPWERGTIDVAQFYDYSDTSSVYSSETDFSEVQSECFPAKKLGVSDHLASTPVISSELEKLLDEALLIPHCRERITLGMGVRALITGKPLRRKNLHGFLITTPSWIDGEQYEDVRVARIMRPRSRQAELFIRLVDKELNSPRGVSMSKALKKFQLAERKIGISASKAGKAAKHLAIWKDLRVRRNRKGELELFA